MRDYDEHFKSDYQGRDIQSAYAEARKMVDIILTPADQTPLEVRQEIARKTVRNFRDHINKGFLEYRKSVTESGNFAYTEWTGQGSVLVDALGREFLDILGGFGLYSYGIRHPKIVAAVKAADYMVTLMEGLEFHSQFLANGKHFDDFAQSARKVLVSALKNGEF